MIGDFEADVREIESRVEWLYRQLHELKTQLDAVRQQQNQQGGGQSGDMSSQGTVYFAKPAGSIAAGSGTWPTITPGSTTADVYYTSGGMLKLKKTGATIYNFFKDATVATTRLGVAPNGDGTYTVISASCTAG